MTETTSSPTSSACSSTRGYVHQMTDAAALDALAAKQVVPGYIGFDPDRAVAPRRQPRPDHAAAPPPAGRAQADRADGRRHRQDRRSVVQGRIAPDAHACDRLGDNVASIRRIFERFLTFGDGPTDAIMLDNAEWLDALEYIPFLREVGQHFSVNRMLSFDSRQAAARPRAVAQLPRIQLHDPAGLRLPRTVAAAPVAGCRWAAATSGGISSTASS